MNRDALVVTAVHPSDDPRIREKLIRSLVPGFDVRYASPEPPPSDPEGIAWIPLRGPRWMRNLRALRICLTDPGDVVSFHDPELLPVAVLTRLIRRRAVVFDVHENVPEQIQTKEWIPAWLRPVLAVGARWTLRIAERLLDVTLAEWGYAGLFRRAHPVFPNYPRADALPPLISERDHAVVYVGDITVPRGAITMVHAMALLPEPRPRLRLIGRCRQDLRHRLEDEARRTGVDLEVMGWRPHGEALAFVARARAGVVPLHDTGNYRFSLPTKLLEYLALGVPVAASDLPGIREVGQALPGVMFAAPGDEQALAGAISAALEDRCLADAVEGAEEVRRRFTWPEAEVRAYYESLASR